MGRRATIALTNGNIFTTHESWVNHREHGIFVIHPQKASNERRRDNATFYPWHAIQSVNYKYPDDPEWEDAS